MKTSRTLIAISIAALIPLGAAVAGDKDKDKSGYAGASFDTLDTNRDGKISQAEAGADSTIMFSSADANSDGYLDKAEWKNRSQGSSTNPAPQSATDPQSSTDPQSTTEAPPADSTVPGDQSASEPTPDTETPRQ